MYFIHIVIMIALIAIYCIQIVVKKEQINKIYTFFVFTIYVIYILLRALSLPIKYGILSTFLGIILFISEIMGCMAFFVYIIIFRNKYNLNKKYISDLRNGIPVVDILIPTYNEEVSLVEKTIYACTKIKYPKNKLNIYVLDDGKNIKLRKLCKEYKVNYITREKNEYAKAGNINNALNKINGEYFLVLDSDMIPYDNILENMMGYFENKNIAFVQAPQTFYNPDVFQFNINQELNNEQDFFMRYIEQARAANGAVLHIGTNAIFKREFVLKVGGYPTSSITEDMALGLLLQAEGYDSVFVNDELACGLSATTYQDLIKQRDRWCRGNLQVMHNFKNVILKKLKLMQKMIYYDGVMYWLSGIAKTVYLIIPIFGFLGIPIVDRFATSLIPLFFLSFLGQILLSKMILPKKISKNYFKIFFSGNIYNTVMAPHLTFSVFKFCTKVDYKFNVTPKDSVNDKKFIYWKFVIPHVAIIVMLIISLSIGIFFTVYKKLSVQAFLINLFWTLYNLPRAYLLNKDCNSTNKK